MRATRSFRYGPRLKLTAPMAAMFSLVAAEMLMIAFARDGAWRYGFGAVGALSTFFALALIREVLGRLRGKRKVVVGMKELEVPNVATLQLKDIKSLAIVGEKGFRRELIVGHANGELKIPGVMLGTTAELDEILGLLRSAVPALREAPSQPRRGRGAGRR